MRRRGLLSIHAVNCYFLFFLPRPFPFADLNAVEYWQRKLKETGIGKLERQVATFVELSVTKESPASTELIDTHTICENKNDDFSFKDNTIATVIKTNGVTFEITNTATPDFIKNLIKALTMLNDATDFKRIFIAAGYTDLRILHTKIKGL